MGYDEKRCYGNSDLGKTYLIWNSSFCWIDNGVRLVAQS